MSHIQGGAESLRGHGFRTKTALKGALKEDPSQVRLYSTGMMGSSYHGAADNLAEGVKFNVVGPDPYTARNWYATVYRKDGKVFCK